jgi:hypothetical protein
VLDRSDDDFAARPGGNGGTALEHEHDETIRARAGLAERPSSGAVRAAPDDRLAEDELSARAARCSGRTVRHAARPRDAGRPSSSAPRPRGRLDRSRRRRTRRRQVAELKPWVVCDRLGGPRRPATHGRRRADHSCGRSAGRSTPLCRRRRYVPTRHSCARARVPCAARVTRALRSDPSLRQEGVPSVSRAHVDRQALEQRAPPRCARASGSAAAPKVWDADAVPRGGGLSLARRCRAGA